MPKYSILMPTRNRGYLLEKAIVGAVSQTFDDYEIIISDNNSKDNTADICKQYMTKNDKIKYYNPGKDLSMCDNWEYVADCATGEYLIYLSDDDAIPAVLLSVLDRIITQSPEIKILVWRRSFYAHPDVPGKAAVSNFQLDLGTGYIFSIPAAAFIDSFFNFVSDVHHFLPKMMNSMITKSQYVAAKEKTAQFFLPPYPDYSAACQLLAINTNIYFIDLSLSICGISYNSNAGIMYNRKAKTEDYFSLYNTDLLAGVPYPMRYLNESYFVKTLMVFKEKYPAAFSREIDIVVYLSTMYRSLVAFEKYEDITEEREMLKKYMREATGNDDLFISLEKEHQKIKNSFAAKIKTIVNNNAILNKITRMIQGFLPKKKKYDFSYSPDTTFHKNVNSITSAAAILSQALSEKQQTLIKKPITIEYQTKNFDHITEQIMQYIHQSKS